MFKFAAIILVSTTGLASIGHASNAMGGPQGRLLMSCSTTNGLINLRVFPAPGRGIVARVSRTTPSGTVKNDFVVGAPKDLAIGRVYEGAEARIVIPNIQNPNQPAGTYTALLAVKGINGDDSIAVSCH